MGSVSARRAAVTCAVSFVGLLALATGVQLQDPLPG